MVKRLMTGVLAVCVIRWALGSFVSRRRRRRRGLEGDAPALALEAEEPQISTADESIPADKAGDLDCYTQELSVDAPEHEGVKEETKPRDKELAKDGFGTAECTGAQRLSDDAAEHGEVAEINPRGKPATEDKKTDKDQFDGDDKGLNEAEAKTRIPKSAASSAVILPSFLPKCNSPEDDRPQVGAFIKIPEVAEEQAEKVLGSQYQRPHDPPWSKVGMRSDTFVPQDRRYALRSQGNGEGNVNARWAHDKCADGGSFDRANYSPRPRTRRNRRCPDHQSRSGRYPDRQSRSGSFFRDPQCANHGGTGDPWLFPRHDRGRRNDQYGRRGRGRKTHADLYNRDAIRSTGGHSIRDRFQS